MPTDARWKDARDEGRRKDHRPEKLLFRLEAQRICLEWAFREIAGRPGIVFEMGLGHGRTYDHLRIHLPEREIYVLDRYPIHRARARTRIFSTPIGPADPLAATDQAAILLRDVLDHGLLPDAKLAGGKVPDDRPFDGIDQSDRLLGDNDSGHREHLLTFVGSDLIAVRWKQAYFADVASGCGGPGGATLLGGEGSSAAPMNSYPKVFNIDSDPHEERNFAKMYNWVLGPGLKTVEALDDALKSASRRHSHNNGTHGAISNNL
ncbi:hypothetical protein LPJGGPFB_04935 [Ensifer adhaerens]|uniref:class I SAM-dependent methyltransferase n=1 Tax=Ensifer adhaerens TaxID=106592 RepID=UPI001AEDC798|nr:class I SAM-dependent methyltransferase [Ensifer adhaerens]NRP21676.1 hypothetical protein [Ensifer adhaerens]